MRQNPMMSSRVQVGGRQMPAWFSGSLINQSRATPPLPAEPPPTTDESEYEEIDHLPGLNGSRRMGRGRACSLCGNSCAVVACEMCEEQEFCGPCNDMYHRHPKRLHHVRKLIEPGGSRPPLPPKTFPPQNQPQPSEMPIVSYLPPVPPPRRNKRFPFGMGMRSATSSPTLVKKTFDPMGTLKRFVGGMSQRPLPATPKYAPPLPPKPASFSRPMTPVMGSHANSQGFDRRHSSPAPQMSPIMHQQPFNRRNLPVHDVQSARQQSSSVVNLNMQRRSPSRNGGFPEWEEANSFVRPRAQSISTPNRYPTSSQDASHFATLQRSRRGPSEIPDRPPPPLPRRTFPPQSQLGFQSSQSACNIHQMEMTPQFGGMPWNYPGQGYPIEFQQQGFGYLGTMQRTPSNQSMGAAPQQFFGWGPMGFGPPMTQQEMEMEIIARRQAEQVWTAANSNQPPPRPPSVTQSQPVTPQGSFRRKTKPSMFQEEQRRNENKMNERFTQNQQLNQRPSTPRSLSRMNASPLHFQQELTKETEGPWTCEYCTFINPKSTNICTVCCKTPSSDGYKSMKKPSQSNNQQQRKGSTSSTNDNEDIPVIQSKLSISRGEQQATINLVESVERIKSGVEKGSKSYTTKPSTIDDNDREEGDEEELIRQAQHHQIKINTKKPKIISARSNMNSNEDVYGVPVPSALTISPKIEIRRHPKSVSTGVGSSPPKANTNLESIERKPLQKKKVSSDAEKVASPLNKNSIRVNKTGKSNKHSSRNNSSSTSSSSSKADSIKKSNLPKQSTSSSSLNPKQTLGGRGRDNGESGNESNPSTSTSGSGGSPNSGIASSSVASDRGQQAMLERKSSKGTSPPPQSISTQTYEELPASKQQQRSQSMAKTSMTSIQSLQSDDFAPPKPIEMSEKALRYARKAQHNHQSKMKRSMSTHLTSESEPWVDIVDTHGRYLYRSSSRHSLFDDTRSLPLSGSSSRDTSPPRGRRYHDDFKQFPLSSWDRLPTSPEDYFASLEDLVTRRRKDSVRTQDFELSRLLKEAEEYNYTPEDIQVALRMCGERNPIKWLQENWSGMIETVQTLATKYGREKGENNQIGTISMTEAKEALRANRGNVWAAVTECIEQRRKKFMELQSRGTFMRDDVLTALTANHGNLDAAYVELSKAQLKPFLMRIWGPPTGLDNDAVPTSPAFNKNISIEAHTPKSNPTPSVPAKIEPTENEKVSQKPVAPVLQPDIEPHKNTPKAVEIENLEPQPRLELLVSNAAKVSQEIEKAIQELKQTKSTTFDSSGHTDKSESSHESVASVVAATGDIQTPQVKSDEDESYVDAISASDSEFQTASAMQEPENLEKTDQIIDEDEDILEIEIDDTEANEISEFIQNYEIVSNVDNISMQTKPSGSDESTVENGKSSAHKTQNETLKDVGQIGDITEPSLLTFLEPETDTSNKENIKAGEILATRDSNVVASENVTTSKENISETNRRISSAEIEQLLSTLTTTFTEMGHFATDIKAQIATEIQQQLAAAVTGLTAQNDQSLDQDSQLDGVHHSYEAVTLTESVTESVNKKIAKYKRLAAKKEQKSSRHKSPDARYTRMKHNKSSQSPSPGSSMSEAAPIENVSQYPENTVSFPNNAQIEITGNPSVINEVSQLEALEDLPRDEGEYNSGPDEEDSDELEMSDEEVEEVSDENSHSADNSSSKHEQEQDSDGELISNADSEEDERLVDGIYEEVDISRSSDPEIYNNKDTQKGVATKPSFVPSTENNNKVSQLPKIETLPEEPEVVPVPVTKTEKEMKVEKLMADGKVETEEKAKLVLQLQDMNFGEEDSVFAANECSSMYTALSFLQQECHLCAGKFNARQMVSMLRCTHVCCKNCAKEYFTVQIRDKSIVDATCPFCSEPTNLTENADGATDYFNHLDIQLKSILESKHHEMFQRKLRDWALAKTPNFKWCSKCSSGFITEPLQTRLICPDCNAVTCAICLEQWDKFNHDHKESKVKVCDSASKTIVDYLNENSIECPRCHFRFALARGGCMHLTCTQCRHEFCSGCSASFRLGDKCEVKLPICVRLGLHAHHPRNCLFYLRDKEPEILGKLLEENAIPYLKENISGPASEDKHAPNKKKRTCQVAIQKDTKDGLKDDVCGREAPEGCATVCKAHYVEYLGLLIWQNYLDPISILSSDDLEVIIRRANKKHPGRPQPTNDTEFRNRLLKVIQEEIPL